MSCASYRNKRLAHGCWAIRSEAKRWVCGGNGTDVERNGTHGAVGERSEARPVPTGHNCIIVGGNRPNQTYPKMNSKIGSALLEGLDEFDSVSSAPQRLPMAASPPMTYRTGIEGIVQFHLDK